jgi:hypothetical protein
VVADEAAVAVRRISASTTGVVGRVDHHADVGVVLRRGAHHRRAADVDQLDARVAAERVEVDHDQVDRLDAVVGHVGLVLRLVGSASRPPCTFGCRVTTRWSRMAGRPVRSARSVTSTPARRPPSAVPPLLTMRQPGGVQPGRQLDDAGLVVDGEQRGGHVPHGTRRGMCSAVTLNRV